MPIWQLVWTIGRNWIKLHDLKFPTAVFMPLRTPESARKTECFKLINQDIWKPMSTNYRRSKSIRMIPICDDCGHFYSGLQSLQVCQKKQRWLLSVQKYLFRISMDSNCCEKIFLVSFSGTNWTILVTYNTSCTNFTGLGFDGLIWIIT